MNVACIISSIKSDVMVSHDSPFPCRLLLCLVLKLALFLNRTDRSRRAGGASNSSTTDNNADLSRFSGAKSISSAQMFGDEDRHSVSLGGQLRKLS